MKCRGCHNKEKESKHSGQGGGPIDGARPTNMSGDLPGKKYQLDLRLFGVRVPTMGCTVIP